MTYPAVGYLARYAGAANTFSLAGLLVLVLIPLSLAVGRGTHQPHASPGR